MPTPLTTYDDDEILRAIQEYQGSGMEDALKEALSLPPAERKAFIESISAAYDPMRTDLRSEISRNYDTLMGPSPQGQVAGNNAFSVYVGANPLEHLASGINKYQAGKDIRSQREQLKKLSEQESMATARVKMAQAEALRRGIRRRDEEDEDVPWWMRRY